MTLADLKTYLIARVGGGGTTVNPAFEKMADACIAGAYNHVWGAHRWTVRRAQATLVTTASTATTNCPEAFERARWISCQYTNRQSHVLIRSEEAFDMDHPYPADDGVGRPFQCKIVYNQAGAADSWKIYWWRVPDQAYTMILAYDRKADLQFFEKLPSHMVKAVQAQALSLMMSGDAQGGNLEVLAGRALKEAIYADTEVSGVLPIFGRDQGWNDFDTEGTSGGVDNPLHW